MSSTRFCFSCRLFTAHITSDNMSMQVSTYVCSAQNLKQRSHLGGGLAGGGLEMTGGGGLGLIGGGEESTGVELGGGETADAGLGGGLHQKKKKS